MTASERRLSHNPLQVLDATLVTLMASRGTLGQFSLFTRLAMDKNAKGVIPTIRRTIAALPANVFAKAQPGESCAPERTNAPSKAPKTAPAGSHSDPRCVLSRGGRLVAAHSHIRAGSRLRRGRCPMGGK